MNNKVEDQLDDMINDLNAVNDEFINDYFDDEVTEEKEEIDFELPTNIEDNQEELEFDEEETKPIIEEKLEELKSEPAHEEKIVIDEKPKFSYNEILSRLDSGEKELNINDTNDLMKLIDRTNDADEFFDKIEEAMDNDK